MSIIENIITVPRAMPVASRVASDTTLADAEPSRLQGRVYNGHTRIFAELAPNAVGDATINFSVSINTVLHDEFEAWRKYIVRGSLLGQKELSIARHSGLQLDDDDPSRRAAEYAVTTLSYVTTQEYGNYDNRSDIEFLQPTDPAGSTIVKKLASLRSQQVELTGTLRASTADPNVEAYIAATYFEFASGAVTSFVSYRGPIVLVASHQERLTEAGVLEPVRTS